MRLRLRLRFSLCHPSFTVVATRPESKKLRVGNKRGTGRGAGHSFAAMPAGRQLHRSSPARQRRIAAAAARSTRLVCLYTLNLYPTPASIGFFPDTPSIAATTATVAAAAVLLLLCAA